MKSVVVVWAALCTAAGTVLAGSSPSAQQQPLRVDTRTVAIYATVTDRDGRLVPDLQRDAFEVRDNGKAQPITVFSNEIQPITVVMMLDRSGSMRGNFRLVEQAAAEFVRRLGGEDKARIGSFAEKIDIQPEEFTGNQQELLSVLEAEMPVQGPTPLWNALDQAIDAVKEQDGRKVVLVFSDGSDAPGLSFNNRSVMDVMRRAQREDVMVYGIGLQSTVLRGPSRRGGIGSMTGSMTVRRPDPALGTIAEDTGGGYFELTRADNLGSTFARVAEELHRQYALGFEPSKLDDKMHEIDVRVNVRGMKVRARKEYFASR